MGFGYQIETCGSLGEPSCRVEFIMIARLKGILVEMSSRKIVVLVLLEPGLSGREYVSSYVPLMKKHIDFSLFEIHVIGSYLGSRILKKTFDNVYIIPFGPTATHGLGLYLGYLLYLIVAFLRLFQLVPKIGVHVLISLGGHAYSGLIVAITARLFRRKSIVRISEPTRYVILWKYRFGSLISCSINVQEWLTFSLSDVVISNRDMCWYSSKIVKKQRLVSQGVDLSLFNPRKAPALHSEGFPKLITVARLDKPKNIHGVIEAVGLLEKKYPEIFYYIVGSGPDEVYLREAVTKFGLDEHVYFYGYVSPEIIAGLLRSCDIFVLPSWGEGLPSAVLEAMACGLPAIVASPKCGWTNWFTNKENALLVDGKPQSIAEAIDQLISNEQLRNTLIVNSLKHVREYHCSSKTKTQLTTIVDKLLKNP